VQSAVPWLHRARTFPVRSGREPFFIRVEVQ
jgi:hypothetical protein